MDINKFQNSKISNKRINMTANAEKNVINKLISQITTQKNNAGNIIENFINQNDNAEKIQHGIYRYKDYYIFNGLKTYFENNLKGYQVAEKTKVQCAPKIVQTIELPNQELVTVLKFNNPTKALYTLDEKLEDMNVIERVDILNDFKRMLNADYVNLDAVNSTDNWRITADNKLLLLNWEDLVKVTDSKQKEMILDSIKKTIRISDDTIPNVYNIY